MATNTYVALQTQTLSSAAASVTFSSIPQGYTDLRLVLSNVAVSGGSDTSLICRFNGDSTNTYSTTNLGARALSTTPFSARQSSTTYALCNWYTAIGTQAGSAVVDFLNYSNATTNKIMLVSSFINEGNATYSGVEKLINLWRSTSAITSFTLSLFNGANMTVGSTFTIYGIAAEGTTPAVKATGGTIYSDSTYYYHVFGSTGTFTPLQSLSADILVVAGGGAGGGYDGGGGGAGGLFGFTSQSLASGTSYTCTVGAGGARGTSSSTYGYGSAGSNSQFGSLTPASVGGGQGIPGGGTNVAYASASGGSGGGGGSGVGANQTLGGAGTSGQGYAGGNSPGATGTYNSGGGGGAGAVGQTPTAGAQAGGIGGDGSTAYATWCAATGVGQNVNGTWYIAGGGTGFWYSDTSTNATRGGYGGGGSGGMGLGTGAASVSPANGKAASGGGGGGGYLIGDTYGTNGGSGVVIVRYLKA